jgi:hypothetical protein
MVVGGAGIGVVAFFLFFGLAMLVTVGGLVVGVAAIISIATTPSERFGPWWDNTKQTWILGLVIGYLVPFGTIVGGIAWFTGGRRGLGSTGTAGRPFWAGPHKPAPIGPPSGYGPPPPSGPPPPGVWRPGENRAG